VRRTQQLESELRELRAVLLALEGPAAAAVAAAATAAVPAAAGSLLQQQRGAIRLSQSQGDSSRPTGVTHAQQQQQQQQQVNSSSRAAAAAAARATDDDDEVVELDYQQEDEEVLGAPVSPQPQLFSFLQPLVPSNRGGGSAAIGSKRDAPPPSFMGGAGKVRGSSACRGGGDGGKGWGNAANSFDVSCRSQPALDQPQTHIHRHTPPRGPGPVSRRGHCCGRVLTGGAESQWPAPSAVQASSAVQAQAAACGHQPSSASREISREAVQQQASSSSCLRFLVVAARVHADLLLHLI